AKGSRLRTRRHDLFQAHADEMPSCAVIERERRWESAANQSMQGRAARRFAIVMRTKSAAQEAETSIEPLRMMPERIGDSALKPAERACAYSRQHDARIPSYAESAIESV